MGPAAILCRLCTRSAQRPCAATILGSNFRSLRWTRSDRSSHWRWSQPPRRDKYATVTLLSSGGAATLGTLAFVEPSDDALIDADSTWESRLLETSRKELETAREIKAKSQGNVVLRTVYGVVSFLDVNLWEPICTAARFIHLFVIFVPVIFTVPVIWVGRRHPEYDNERSGTLWWYRFLVRAMEWSGPTFIKVLWLSGEAFISSLC